MYGRAGLSGNSSGGSAYGFPSPRRPIQPYDQYVQASVESSSGAASGTSWIAAASTITARVEGAVRRIASSATRYAAKAPTRRTRKSGAVPETLPPSRRHERGVGPPGESAGRGDEREDDHTRRDGAVSRVRSAASWPWSWPGSSRSGSCPSVVVSVVVVSVVVVSA